MCKGPGAKEHIVNPRDGEKTDVSRAGVGRRRAETRRSPSCHRKDFDLYRESNGKKASKDGKQRGDVHLEMTVLAAACRLATRPLSRTSPLPFRTAAKPRPRSPQGQAS